MKEPAEYGKHTAPIPVFYVLEIYQNTFRHERPVVEIHAAEPLSPICVGDYLYEVSFPDPLVVPHGHILQATAKQHVISTQAGDQVTHITKVCVKAVSTGRTFLNSMRTRGLQFEVTRKKYFNRIIK
jgi:hypothetical protein